MLAFYLTVLIFVCMVWYAGLEGTMRVFAYIDLQMRYLGIKFQMWKMKRQLEKQLGLPPTKFSTVFKEIDDD
ncbi:hypothetical protein SWPG_00021 [Synechococcus phage S-CBM2]|nr:hypothetical protein SWPG_00021 [Synechococcus phage S-CBM2]